MNVSFEQAKELALYYFCGKKTTEEKMKDESGYSILESGDEGDTWGFSINQIDPKLGMLVPGIPTFHVDKKTGETIERGIHGVIAVHPPVMEILENQEVE